MLRRKHALNSRVSIEILPLAAVEQFSQAYVS